MAHGPSDEHNPLVTEVLNRDALRDSAISPICPFSYQLSNYRLVHCDELSASISDFSDRVRGAHTAALISYESTFCVAVISSHRPWYNKLLHYWFNAHLRTGNHPKIALPPSLRHWNDFLFFSSLTFIQIDEAIYHSANFYVFSLCRGDDKGEDVERYEWIPISIHEYRELLSGTIWRLRLPRFRIESFKISIGKHTIVQASVFSSQRGRTLSTPIFSSGSPHGNLEGFISKCWRIFKLPGSQVVIAASHNLIKSHHSQSRHRRGCKELEMRERDISHLKPQGIKGISRSLKKVALVSLNGETSIPISIGMWFMNLARTPLPTNAPRTRFLWHQMAAFNFATCLGEDWETWAPEAWHGVRSHKVRKLSFANIYRNVWPLVRLVKEASSKSKNRVTPWSPEVESHHFTYSYRIMVDDRWRICVKLKLDGWE